MSTITDQLKETISNINQKNPYYIVGGALILVLVLDYFLILQNQLKAIGQLMPNMTTLSTELESGQVNIRHMPDNLKELEKLQQKKQKVNEKIKTEEQVPLILENISRLASRNGVQVEKITPNTAEKKAAFQNDEGKYFVIPIDIEALGGYHDFGRFLNQLENEEVFLSVKSFSIMARPQEKAKHGLKLELDAIIFEKSGK